MPVALVWLAASIIAYFTADTIMSHLSTTTKEKEKLLNATAKIAKDLNLSADQTAKILAQTQSEAGGTNSSSFGDILKYGIIGIGAILLLTNLNKK